MAKEEKKEERKHKATYASDKKTGGYLVRVIGPNAADFAGREVPVTTMTGVEHMEKLTKLVWSGVDKGWEDRPGTGLPAALYKFESKPKEKKETVF